jgi:hypothetical protein
LEPLNDPSMCRGELWNCGDELRLKLAERRTPLIYTEEALTDIIA